MDEQDGNTPPVTKPGSYSEPQPGGLKKLKKASEHLLAVMDESMNLQTWMSVALMGSVVLVFLLIGQKMIDYEGGTSTAQPLL